MTRPSIEQQLVLYVLSQPKRNQDDEFQGWEGLDELDDYGWALRQSSSSHVPGCM